MAVGIDFSFQHLLGIGHQVLVVVSHLLACRFVVVVGLQNLHLDGGFEVVGLQFGLACADLAGAYLTSVEVGDGQRDGESGAVAYEFWCRGFLVAHPGAVFGPQRKVYIGHAFATDRENLALCGLGQVVCRG